MGFLLGRSHFPDVFLLTILLREKKSLCFFSVFADLKNISFKEKLYLYYKYCYTKCEEYINLIFTKIFQSSHVWYNNVKYSTIFLWTYWWVRGVMILESWCKFRDRGSILSEYLILRDVDLKSRQVNFAIASVVSS